jgi:hypothetical protein
MAMEKKLEIYGSARSRSCGLGCVGREEAMIERRRRRNEYNSNEAVIAREIEARNREPQQKEERAIVQLKESERRSWENYGHLLDLPDDPDISPKRVINRGDNDK